MQYVKISAEKHENEIGGSPLVRPMLVGCIVLALSVCFAQIIGNSMIILTVLVFFLGLVVLSNAADLSLPVLLFFLPWSPLLKLYQGGISFFTIGLFICCVGALIKNHFIVRRYQVILPFILLIITLVAKFFRGNSMSNSYVFFFAMLVLFPCITSEVVKKTDLWTLTMFFSLGIMVSALSAQHVATYPNISKFIKVDSYLSITRLSGYYGDPNFYSAHITACAAGIQLLLVSEQKKARRIYLIIAEIILIYCGLLSASKSFVVVFAIMFMLWIPIILEKRERGTGRVQMIVGILCAAIIILSLSGFQELFRILDDRFAYASNMSQITTGRTDLWIRYTRVFLHDPLLTLFGEGFSNVNIGGRASHNTLIQGIYQFGIVGFPLLLIWLRTTMNTVFSGMEKKIPWKNLALIYAGVMLPWLGLDILFFDEFFLLSLYVTGIVSLYSKDQLDMKQFELKHK